MNSNLISNWRAKYNRTSSTVIIPDGCRDLIVKTIGNEKPNWLVSPLFDRPEPLQIEANCEFVGFRLIPGAQIRERALLNYIETRQFHAEDVKKFYRRFCFFRKLYCRSPRMLFPRHKFC